MIAPPDRFENMLNQVKTLQIVAISIMSVVCALLVVLIHALHRVGATMREFLSIFRLTDDSVTTSTPNKKRRDS